MKTLTTKELTKEIDRLQRRHPNTRRQRSYHGARKYSVQFFDKATGKLVADYNLPLGPLSPSAESDWSRGE